MMGKKKRQNDSNQNVKLYAFDLCPQPQLSIPYAKEVNCNKFLWKSCLNDLYSLIYYGNWALFHAISAYNWNSHLDDLMIFIISFSTEIMVDFWTLKLVWKLF